MYKCSVKSQLVLDQIKSRCQSDTSTDNKWKGRSGNYMFIMGRENPDGKATGVVHKYAPDGVTPKLAGSFKILSDGWTAVTRDKSLSAQFEHSIGVTSNGYEVFTNSPKGYTQPDYPI